MNPVAWLFVILGLLATGFGGGIETMRLHYRPIVVDLKLQIAKIEAETKIVTERSKTIVEAINEQHKVKLAEAETNAVANYKRRHPVAAGVCLPAANTASGVAVSTQSADGASAQSVVACQPDEQFIRDSADDASKIGEWQEWARMNKLLME